jgi:hypothetical protein
MSTNFCGVFLYDHVLMYLIIPGYQLCIYDKVTYPVELFRKPISAAHVPVCRVYCHHIISSNFMMFLPVIILLNQWCAAPLRLQVAECDTFLVTIFFLFFFFAKYTEGLPRITS